MTHEERANWIRRGFLLFLAIAVVAGAWFFPDSKPSATSEDTEAEAVVYDLEIFHYHVPGKPESEQIAVSLNKIGSKYEKYVRVTRVDITQHPEIAKVEMVTKPPKVVMKVGEERTCKFQGVWTYDQIERKVEEILRGLERMDENWRPDVHGMQPATNSAPASPLTPVTP